MDFQHTQATAAKHEAKERFDHSDPACHEFLVSVSARFGDAVGGPYAGASTAYVFSDGSEIIRTNSGVYEVITHVNGVRVFKQV